MKTLDEVIRSDKEMLTPADVAPILGVKPYSINVQVSQDIIRGVNSFPFEVMKIGTRVKIPRLAFIRSMRGDS